MEPPKREDSYRTAYKKAQADLEGLNLIERAKSAGFIVESHPEGVAIFKFLGQDVKILLEERVVVDASSGEPLPLWSQILILHHIRDIKDNIFPSYKWITFKEVPSGEFYLSAFDKRTKELAIKFFGDNLDLIHSVAPKIGGEPYSGVGGDISYLFKLFPKIPVVLVVYKPDEEFSADAKLLFDETIPDLMCTEDIAVISTMLVIRLGEALQEIG